MPPFHPAGVPLLGEGLRRRPEGPLLCCTRARPRAHAHAPSLSLLVMAHRRPLLLTTTTTTTHAPSATKSKIVCGPESRSRDEKKKKKNRTTRRIIAWLTPPLKKCETHDQVPASFLLFVLCFFPLPHVFSRNGRGGICVGWICFLDFRCRGLVLFGVLSWLLFFPLTLCTHKQRIERAIVVCVIWFFF